MNCGVGFENCLCGVSSQSLPWQHIERQLGWYISETLRNRLQNLLHCTVHFVTEVISL